MDIFVFNTHIRTKIVRRISDAIERKLEVRSNDDADMFFLIKDIVDDTLILMELTLDTEDAIQPVNFELYDDIDDLSSIYLKETMPCG